MAMQFSGHCPFREEVPKKDIPGTLTDMVVLTDSRGLQVLFLLFQTTGGVGGGLMKVLISCSTSSFY